MELDDVINASGPYYKWALDQRKQYIDLRLRQDPEIRTLYQQASQQITRQLRDLENRGYTQLSLQHLEALEDQLSIETRILNEQLTSKLDEYLELGVKAGTYTSEKVTVEALKGANIRIQSYQNSVLRVNHDAVQAMWGRSINGLNLSDRIWKTSNTTRDHLSRIMREAMTVGQSPLKTAELLQEYIKDGSATVSGKYPDLMKRVNPPKDLAYEALRLARTETTAAYGEGVIASAKTTPMVKGVQWLLSPSHPIYDVCDELAAKDTGLGPGIYEVDEVPVFPPHPNCLCTLVTVFEELESFVSNLKEWLDDPSSHPEIEQWYQENAA
ncbi:hypothetical protein DH09_08255 [Bacillaceae bacterium JMAK1]|nr:hypothetical protein DH09_08255 [Bacillaceae bacterium JMAK1]